jgi:arylsulfatase A-like enzyme
MNKFPNILLIVSDQHRVDCMGCSNEYPVLTPNLDMLASEGTRFTHAFTPIPLCCPARQSFLTGRRPESQGTLWNYDLGPKIPQLSPSEYSWPRELEKLGYRSAYLGKWHVSADHDPTDFGYDEYVSEFTYNQYRADAHPDKDFQNGWFGEIDQVPLEETRTHWFAQKACDTLERFSEDEQQPWHIRLDFTEPHLPCNPVEEFLEYYDATEIPEWKNFNEEFIDKPYIQQQQLLNWGLESYTWSDWSTIVARYYAIITQMDHAIGMVLNALDPETARNTLVIYTSDHGDMCGAHRMMDKHYVLYDDIVRVPLIMRWPRKITANSICDEFVYNILDLPPTILELLDVQPSVDFHGSSLVPILRKQGLGDWRKEVVSTYNGQQFGLYTQRMIRTNKCKYVWNTTDVDELYDLINDPEELVNLIHTDGHEAILKELRLRLYEVLHREGDTLVDNDWMRRQLLEGRIL